jgi:hypothetical protein
MRGARREAKSESHSTLKQSKKMSDSYYIPAVGGSDTRCIGARHWERRCLIAFATLASIQVFYHKINHREAIHTLL